MTPLTYGHQKGIFMNRYRVWNVVEASGKDSRPSDVLVRNKNLLFVLHLHKKSKSAALFKLIWPVFMCSSPSTSCGSTHCFLLKQNILGIIWGGNSFIHPVLHSNLNSISFNYDTSVFWTIIGTFMIYDYMMGFRAENYNSQCLCLPLSCCWRCCLYQLSWKVITKFNAECSQFSLQSLWWTSPCSAHISDLRNGHLGPFWKKKDKGCIWLFRYKNSVCIVCTTCMIS